MTADDVPDILDSDIEKWGGGSILTWPWLKRTAVIHSDA